MNNQRDKSKIINYLPEELRNYEVLCYEWIDNLCFTIDPIDCLNNSEEYIKIAKEIFLEAGWHGDGKVELMWIPPFMFNGIRTADSNLGVIVWHVKQNEDGISWILHPKNIFGQ